MRPPSDEGRVTPETWSQERTTGGILIARRIRGGFTPADVARADGHWSDIEVTNLERQSDWPSAAAARYIVALVRLEREVKPRC